MDVATIDGAIVGRSWHVRQQQWRWLSLSRPGPSSRSSTSLPSTDWHRSHTWCGNHHIDYCGKNSAATHQTLRMCAVSSPACNPAQDEPFHVRQTQQYCLGNWADWDPKITTFPGLYVAGVAYARLLQLAGPLWRGPHVSIH